MRTVNWIGINAMGSKNIIYNYQVKIETGTSQYEKSPSKSTYRKVKSN